MTRWMDRIFVSRILIMSDTARAKVYLKSSCNSTQKPAES